MTLGKLIAAAGIIALALAACSKEDEKTSSGKAQTPVTVARVSACSLLAPADVASAIGAPSVAAAPERGMGGDAGQVYKSTCVWSVVAASLAPASGTTAAATIVQVQ